MNPVSGKKWPLFAGPINFCSKEARFRRQSHECRRTCALQVLAVARLITDSVKILRFWTLCTSDTNEFCVRMYSPAQKQLNHLWSLFICFYFDLNVFVFTFHQLYPPQESAVFIMWNPLYLTFFLSFLISFHAPALNIEEIRVRVTSWVREREEPPDFVWQQISFIGCLFSGNTFEECSYWHGWLSQTGN